MADLDGYIGFPGVEPESISDGREAYLSASGPPGIFLADDRSGDAMVPVLKSSLLKAVRRVPIIPTHRTLSSR